MTEHDRVPRVEACYFFESIPFNRFRLPTPGSWLRAINKIDPGPQ